MTRIYNIRHGQSEANRQRILAGHIDFPLSPLGVEQARLTAEFLKDVPVDAIYSSSLLRARVTGEANLKYHDVPFFTDDGLIETFLGDWEGVPKANLLADPMYQTFCSTYIDTVFPSGESVFDAGVRYGEALSRIAEAYPNGSVIVASHAGVIRALWGELLGLSPLDYEKDLFFPSNASVTVFDFDGERLLPVAYSLDEHLRSLC